MIIASDDRHLRRPDDSFRRHAEPHAFAARAARADGLGALHRPAASAVHVQPASEDVAGCQLAPFVGRVIAVDRSGEMLQAARKRVRDLSSVEVRRGELEALPIPDDELDAATLLLVLHHLPDPASALSEAYRTLKPGGRLVIADMLPHDREEYRQQMGHVWLGFSEEHMRRLLAAAGFDRVRIVGLPVNAAANGP